LAIKSALFGLTHIVHIIMYVTNFATRRHFHSARHHLLTTQHYWLRTYGRWAFSIAAPATLNSLPAGLPDLALSFNSFRQQLKKALFSSHEHIQHIRAVIIVDAHYKFKLTLTFT